MVRLFLWFVFDDTSKWQQTWKQTPAWELAMAVKGQNTATINKIAKAHPQLLNYQEPKDGRTLLMWAVGEEKYRSLDALLHCGANPNIASTSVGETALGQAARYSWVDRECKQDPKYVKLLLQHGADPNLNYRGCSTHKDDVSRDGTEQGTSPLMESIGHGLEKTRALVEAGADINHKTISGRTAAIQALLTASMSANDDKMEYAYYLIVEKKAKITEPYYRGELYALSDENPHDKFYPVNLLKYWQPEINS
ncbi:MAG TPA: ankyrin repeat domain-containing protein, partial [Armatimonadota bacterium]